MSCDEHTHCSEHYEFTTILTITMISSRIRDLKPVCVPASIYLKKDRPPDYKQTIKKALLTNGLQTDPKGLLLRALSG